MKTLSPSLKFFLNLAKVQAVTTRRFDASLNGLGLTEFMILFHLSQAEHEKMRRIDLADKVGLTASGITRLLAPMEKIGLVQREANAHDARVSFVVLAPGGKNKLFDSIERAELLSADLLPDSAQKKIEKLSELLAEMGGGIL